jgi:CheY-like chemotaxis protein
MVLRAAETLERNIRAQAQMVSDLLDVSRIASGKIRLEHERIDVPALVAAAVESLRPSADAKGVALDVELAPDPLEMSGDPARLQQIVGNLAGNAIKFTPAGGRVVVRVRAAGAVAEIEVEDTGAGIAPELLPHVFDRFVQSEHSTTRRHGGLGLGLAIVRDLTALHGGSVRVASAGVGRGACFTVALPAVEAATRTPAGPAPPPPADLSALDVLLVEDDDDTRAALEAVLDCAGARVRATASAQEALAAYDARRPDVVVSDIGMPGRDGYELVRAIRAREAEAGPRTPAIALTGFASGGDRDAALAAGYDRHLPKPIGPTALLACIHELQPRRE